MAEDEGENPEEGRKTKPLKKMGKSLKKTAADAGETAEIPVKKSRKKMNALKNQKRTAAMIQKKVKKAETPVKMERTVKKVKIPMNTKKNIPVRRGQSMERENPDDIADPDSDTQESGNDSDGEGTGGGKPDEKNPQQSDEEGSSRKNDQSGEGLEGQDDHHRPEGKNNGADSLEGSTDEGRRDDSMAKILLPESSIRTTAL